MAKLTKTSGKLDLPEKANPAAFQWDSDADGIQAPMEDGISGGRRATRDVLAFERSVVGFFVEAADILGVPKSVAAIYGICFASPEPLAFSEINERLQLSSGSISQGLKILREVGALKVITTDTDKRSRFKPDLELRKLISRFIEERLEKQLVASNSRLASLLCAVPPSTNRQALEVRIKALQTWAGKAGGVLPIVKTFLRLT